MSESDQKWGHRGVNPGLIEAAYKASAPLRRYHQYKVVGMEHLPKKGPLVFVVNHSLVTYDGFLLGGEVIRARGRMSFALGDNLIFKIPGLRELAYQIGIWPANPENGLHLLKEGELIFIAPGGMREALRPSEERHKVRWDKRKGFVRLAIRSQAPIMLGACPRADEIYQVFENRLTKLAYRYLKVPLPLILGRSGTPFPKPIPLTHYLAPPLIPPPFCEETFEKDTADFHREVVTAMNQLMATAAAAEGAI